MHEDRIVERRERLEELLQAFAPERQVPGGGVEYEPPPIMAIRKGYEAAKAVGKFSVRQAVRGAKAALGKAKEWYQRRKSPSSMVASSRPKSGAKKMIFGRPAVFRGGRWEVERK